MQRSTRHAFTIMEIVIAASLSLVFAAMIAQTISSSVRVTGSTITRAEVESRSRELFRTTIASLREAQPFSTCLVPGAATKDSKNCTVLSVAPGATAILVAKPDELVFSGTERCTTSSTGDCPQIVRIRLDRGSAVAGPNAGDGVLLIDSFVAAGAQSYIDYPNSWLNPVFGQDGSLFGVAPTSTRRLGELSKFYVQSEQTQCNGAPRLFRYLTTNGLYLDENCSPVSSRASIAAISFDVKLSAKNLVSDKRQSLNLEAVAAVPSAAYVRGEALK
jgi:hypothetical protein